MGRRFFNDVHVGLSKGIGGKHVAEEPGSHKQGDENWRSGIKVRSVSEKILEGIVLKDPTRRGFPFLNEGEKFENSGMT